MHVATMTSTQMEQRDLNIAVSDFTLSNGAIPS